MCANLILNKIIIKKRNGVQLWVGTGKWNKKAVSSGIGPNSWQQDPSCDIAPIGFGSVRFLLHDAAWGFT